MKEITILILFSLALTSFSATYYVSTAGADSLPGTFAQPWRNPGYGSTHISGGDTLIILSGTYYFSDYGEDPIRPPHGNPGAPTVIEGQGTTKPLLLGSNNLLAIFELGTYWDCRNYVTIENFEIASLIDTPYTDGLRCGVEGGGWGDTVDHYTFKNISVHHVEETGFNLAGDSRYITFDVCTVHHSGMFAVGGPEAFAGGWQNVLIENCYLGYAGHFYEGVEQFSPWDRPDGFGIEESEGPIVISHTTAEHNRGDGLDSKSKRTYIHHCTVANNFADGIKLWGDSSRVENTLIYGTGDGDTISSPWCLLVIDTDDSNAYFAVTNVTMWDSPDRNPHYVATIQYDNSDIPVTLTMKNNIISGGRRPFHANPIVNVIAENNLFYLNWDVQIYANGIDYDSINIGSLGSGNIFDDPLFVAPAWGADGNFHLQSGSPARDGGTAVPLTDDLDGNSRPQGSAYDIGCYEYDELFVMNVAPRP